MATLDIPCRKAENVSRVRVKPSWKKAFQRERMPVVSDGEAFPPNLCSIVVRGTFAERRGRRVSDAGLLEAVIEAQVC